ncbi:MAG: 30S ribosomal protein S17 [Moraxellaceae bacterium]|nr:MAG: 30S ribosomal protein S17 [Moraxellaceae bacterium]
MAATETTTSVVRNLRKTRTGLVTSNKMDKTITVKVERKIKHPAVEAILNASHGGVFSNDAAII